MLELPESYYIAKQVEEHLKGKIISYIEVLHTPHKFAFFQGDRDTYEDLLGGQTIEGAVNRGGMLEITTENSMLFLSDGAYPKYFEEKKNSQRIISLPFILMMRLRCLCLFRCMDLSVYFQRENARTDTIFLQAVNPVL